MSLEAVVRSNVRLVDDAAAIAFFRPTFVDTRREALRIAHLDAGRALIGMRMHESNLCDEVEFPLRSIIRDAVTMDTVGMILAHNHPSGDAAPSRQDLRATRSLIALLRPLGVRIHDHLIFAGSEVRSLRAMGLL